MNTNFFIEVKTKWILENNVFSRQIIKYELNKSPEQHDGSLRDRLLKESESYLEQVDYIESNEMEINAIDKETGQIIENKTALMDMLLSFTKYKYQAE